MFGTRIMARQEVGKARVGVKDLLDMDNDHLPVGKPALRCAGNLHFVQLQNGVWIFQPSLYLDDPPVSGRNNLHQLAVEAVDELLQGIWFPCFQREAVKADLGEVT